MCDWLRPGCVRVAKIKTGECVFVAGLRPECVCGGN